MREKASEAYSEILKMKEIVTLGDLELNLEELAVFLIDANKEAYSGQNKHILTDSGIKKFVFRDKNGKFYFSDEHRGDYQFAGKKTVEINAHEADLPEGDWRTIWQMNYFGGVLPEFIGDKKIVRRVESFLRPALMRVPLEANFSGRALSSEIGSYAITFKGDIKKFNGGINIELREADKKDRAEGNGVSPIFSLDYHGGLII